MGAIISVRGAKSKKESTDQVGAKPKEEPALEDTEVVTLKILTLGGSENQVKAGLWWSVQKLIAELFDVLKISESSTETKTILLTFREVELEPSAILKDCGICEGSEISILVKKEPRPPALDDIREDIGIFESQKLGSPGADWLRRDAPLPLPSEVHHLISLLAGKTSAEYKAFGAPGMDGLDKVRSYIDDLLEDEVSKKGNACFDQTDFKIRLSPQKLISLAGSSLYSKLVAIFGNEPDEIVVRRCQAHGRCINFHIDHSKKVLQVALNSDEEYCGGRLVFATQGGLEIPKRNVGTVTLHHSDMVHGVTELEDGVRYGLFFLDKTSQKL